MRSMIYHELLCCLLLLGIPSWGVGKPSQRESRASRSAASVSQKQGQQSADELEKKYVQAEQLFKDGKFAEAKELFDQIWFAPGGGSYKQTASYLEKIKIALDEKAGESKSEGAVAANQPAPNPLVLPGLEDSKPAAGGQALPSLGGGGVSSAERVSRLLMDGRTAFQDGDFDGANKRFKDVLSLDSENAEAQKYLSEIGRVKGRARFSPTITLADLAQRAPVKSSTLGDKPAADDDATAKKDAKSAGPSSPSAEGVPSKDAAAADHKAGKIPVKPTDAKPEVPAAVASAPKSTENTKPADAARVVQNSRETVSDKKPAAADAKAVDAAKEPKKDLPKEEAVAPATVPVSAVQKPAEAAPGKDVAAPPVQKKDDATKPTDNTAKAATAPEKKAEVAEKPASPAPGSEAARKDVAQAEKKAEPASEQPNAPAVQAASTDNGPKKVVQSIAQASANRLTMNAQVSFEPVEKKTASVGSNANDASRVEVFASPAIVQQKAGEKKPTAEARQTNAEPQKLQVASKEEKPAPVANVPAKASDASKKAVVEAPKSSVESKPAAADAGAKKPIQDAAAQAAADLHKAADKIVASAAAAAKDSVKADKSILLVTPPPSASILANSDAKKTATNLASEPSLAVNEPLRVLEILPEVKEKKEVASAAKPADAKLPDPAAKKEVASPKADAPVVAAKADAPKTDSKPAKTDTKVEAPAKVAGQKADPKATQLNQDAVNAIQKIAKDFASAKPQVASLAPGPQVGAGVKSISSALQSAASAAAEQKPAAASTEKKVEEAKPAAATASNIPAEKMTVPGKKGPSLQEALSKINEASKAAESARAVASKEAAQRSSDQTNEGITLFNQGRYSEAFEKFTNALVSDPSNSEAQQFKARAMEQMDSHNSRNEKLVASAIPNKLPKAAGEAEDLDKNKQTVAAATATATPADGKKSDDKKSAAGKEKKAEKSDNAKKPTDMVPLNAVTAADGSADSKDKGKDAKKSSDASNPRAEADKKVRQAQRELDKGNRDEALKTARDAAAIDPSSVEAKALIDELENPASSAPKSAAKAKSGRSRNASDDSAGSAVVGVNGLIEEGKNQFETGRLEEALVSFRSALDMDPGNAVAKRYISQIEAAHSHQSGMAGGSGPATASVGRVSPEQAEAAFQKGLVAYEAGRLDVAVQWWNYTLTIDPRNAQSIKYLQQTKPEYDAWVQQHQYNAIQVQKEAGATEKLDSLITYDTAGQKSITEFLSAMSLISDVSFYVAAGVDPGIPITAKFEDTPLHDALDIVLLPIGLKWSRTADVITITADLRTKFFNLSSEQVNRLKTLLENKTLQRFLYGPEATPAVSNVELTLDDRENILVVTDSQENINKVESFLKDLQLASPPGLVYKSWKIRPEEGQKIKALVEAIVKVQSDAPYDLERKVVVDGEDLIVKDTASNVSKIEQLLLDKNFVRKLETQKLQVSTFNLTPHEPISENLEQVRDLAQNIVTVVKTILYSQSRESVAAAEGRRYWYDPNTLQLTITDYPENLEVVSDYIRSLPMIGGKKQKSEIVFLKHQTASDLNDLLQKVLGLGATDLTANPAVGGASVTRTLRVEGELTFRDIRIRVTKVNANDLIDKNDDSVEMVVRTPTNSEERTIVEYRSEFVEDYEINVLEVRPSGTPGEGSARIEVRYNPAATGATIVAPGQPVGAVGAVGPNGQVVGGVVGGVTGTAGQATTDNGVGTLNVSVDTIDNLNALLLRYSDAGDLAEVKGWIEQLDTPILQVSIETKLVEVNETRAKEWMPEFNIANIGKAGINTQNSSLNGGFAQDIDEFRSPFDPFPEDPFNAGLLKGTTVLSFIAPGETPLNFTLRSLESEGIVNIVNGPHVVVVNGQTADFQIERQFGGLPTITSTGGGTGGTQVTGAIQTMTQVDLSVSPKITQLGEIELDIQNLELRDFGNNSAPTVVSIDGNGDGTVQAFEPTGLAQGLNFDVRHRTLQTVARVHNGGTIVLGGWTGEHSRTNDAGVPLLRNLPYIGHLFFGRSSDRMDKTTLLIFLTCHLIEP